MVIILAALYLLAAVGIAAVLTDGFRAGDIKAALGCSLLWPLGVIAFLGVLITNAFGKDARNV